MARLILIAAICLAVTSCEPDKFEQPVTAPAEGPHQRFQAELQGRFYAGYGNHQRDIMLITDTSTGKKYLAITGVGVTELWEETHVHSDGKHTTTTTETVEE